MSDRAALLHDARRARYALESIAMSFELIARSMERIAVTLSEPDEPPPGGPIADELAASPDHDMLTNDDEYPENER